MEIDRNVAHSLLANKIPFPGSFFEGYTRKIQFDFLGDKAITRGEIEQLEWIRRKD